ncbi:MAG: bifunctional DNA primase/polymerase [Thermoanaerobaculia bacterium]
MTLLARKTVGQKSSQLDFSTLADAVEEREVERLEREAIAALDEIDYARLGWYTQQTVGKVPLWDSEKHSIPPTRDEAEIRRRWAEQPAAGVSLALEPSRLFSLDVDAHRGGEETAARTLTGELPPHPVCTTPRGGRHLIFRAPVCSEIAEQKDGLGQGVDVLAYRCTIPPTPGYSWLVSPLDAPAPYLPLWLWRLLPKVAERPRLKRAAKRALRFRLEDVRPYLERLKGSSSRGWTACCPAHEDRHPSFSITIGDDGQPLFHCFAGCSFERIVAALERVAGVRGAA